MVHTYSLIHDDLPCMDNDDYRRGRLTNHKVFGEANAVLAGDALLTAAFGSLAKAELPAERICKAVALLSKCAGECGMVGGQVLDLAGEQLVLTEEEIYNVHRLKTGALISAACQLGVIAAGGTQEQLDAADRYAEALGLAFQTRDDMLDVLGDSGKMGKATGMDEAQLLADAKEPALKQVRMDLAMAAIIKEENIDATDEEVEAEFQRMADQYGMDLETVKKYLQAEQVKDQLRSQKAIAVVVDSATAVKAEKKPAKKTAKKAEDAEGEEAAEEKPAKKTTRKKADEDGEEKKPAKKATKKAAAKKEEETPAESK